MRSKILTADVLFLRDEFFKLTELQREVFLDLVDPQPEVAPMKSKPTKPATKRVIEKCATEGCGLTRRAQVHKDASADGYHVFSDPHGTRRSARAESLAGAIKKKTGDKEPRCIVCFEIRDHANHDVSDGGHEFMTDLAGRVNAVLDGATKPDPDDEERCAATREGGRTCNLLLDHNVHQMKTAMGYHEFVGSETAVGVGG